MSTFIDIQIIVKVRVSGRGEYFLTGNLAHIYQAKLTTVFFLVKRTFLLGHVFS